jgi:tetratricopeptide (TPR) repeat protein
MANKIRAEKGIEFFEKQALAFSMLEGATPAEFWGIPSDKIASIFQFACELYDSGRYEDASDVFLLLTAVCPDGADYWRGLGFASQQIKDYASAAIAYENAISLQGNQAELYPYLIQVLCDMEREDLVKMVLKDLLEQSFEDDPTQLEAIREQSWLIARDILEKRRSA